MIKEKALELLTETINTYFDLQGQGDDEQNAHDVEAMEKYIYDNLK